MSDRAEMFYNNYSEDDEIFFEGFIKHQIFSMISCSVEFNITMKNKNGELLGKSEFKLKFNSMTEIDWTYSQGYCEYKGNRIDMSIYK